jgi:L-fucose mutarotase
MTQNESPEPLGAYRPGCKPEQCIPGPSLPELKELPVLKNLDPIITGDLLRVLDSIQPGQSLAVLSDENPYQHLNLPSVQIPPVSLEHAVEAIFSALPLATDGNPPILSWFTQPTGEHAEDIAYAVTGLASDAELRRIEVTTVADSRDFAAAMDDTVATITLPTVDSPWAFLIRAGV